MIVRADDVFGHREGTRVSLVDEGSARCPCESGLGAKNRTDGSVRVFAGAPPAFFTCAQKVSRASAGMVLGMHATYQTGVPPVIEDLLMPRGAGPRWHTDNAVHNVTTLRAVYVVIDFPAGRSYNVTTVRALAENGKGALQAFISAMHRRFGIPVAGEFMLTDTCMGRQLCKHYYRHDPPDSAAAKVGCFRAGLETYCGAGCSTKSTAGGHMENSLDTSLLKLTNFKNSAAYMFGIARVGEFARFVVHIDTDWSIRLVPQIPWAASALPGANWIERAVRMLEQNHESYIIEVGSYNVPPTTKIEIDAEIKRCACGVSLQAFVLDTKLLQDRVLPFMFGHTEGALYQTCGLHKQNGGAKFCSMHFWGASVVGVRKKERAES